MGDRQLILASASPRRKALMNEAGLSFKVIVSEVEEIAENGEMPSMMVERLAHIKAEAVVKKAKDALVIGADTIVVLDGYILGKPVDEEDAARMLNMLSGREHFVYTGVSIIDAKNGQHHTSHSVTTVKFRKLTPEIIERYILTKEPMDKAGAYAIQGVGTFLVDSIVGDYSNVVGLSMPLLARLLSQHGYTVI